ncbi:hypothetical protein D027_4717B, partial [Vibrio parahaemolyticus 861]
TLPKTLP